MRQDIIFDTSLLVLLCVGWTSVELIRKHKRTAKSFDESDFELALVLIDKSDRIVTTPYLLAEASNLLGQHGEPERSRVIETLKSLIESAQETYHTGKQIISTEVFTRLGVGDASVVRAAKRRKVITTDLNLFTWLCGKGVDAINFNHLRDA